MTIGTRLISGNVDVIASSAVTLRLEANIPVVTTENCLGCHVHLSREDPAAEEFQLLTIRSGGGEIHEGGEVCAVPEPAEGTQSITRRLEGRWTTEKVVRENGYQTTERELEKNLAREERDEKKFGKRPPNPKQTNKQTNKQD